MLLSRDLHMTREKGRTDLGGGGGGIVQLMLAMRMLEGLLSGEGCFCFSHSLLI